MLLRIEKKRLLELAPFTQRAFKTALKQHLFESAVQSLPQDDGSSFTFERIVGSPTGTYDSQTEVKIRDGSYEYEDDHWYVVFANQELGGGYLNQGFVQEEILTIECPEVAIALSQFNWLGPLGQNEVGIYTNVDRGCQILIYGRQRVGAKGNLKEAIQRVPPKRIHLLAMNAINVSKKREGATREDLRYMLDKAVIGFRAVVERGGQEIQTGKWGCGVYGNDLLSITMITILAARKAGLSRVVFYLYDGSGREIVEECMKLSSAQIEERLF